MIVGCFGVCKKRAGRRRRIYLIGGAYYLYSPRRWLLRLLFVFPKDCAQNPPFRGLLSEWQGESEKRPITSKRQPSVVTPVMPARLAVPTASYDSAFPLKLREKSPAIHISRKSIQSIFHCLPLLRRGRRGRLWRRPRIRFVSADTITIFVRGDHAFVGDDGFGVSPDVARRTS